MKNKARFILNLLIAVAVFSAWIGMFFGSNGTLSSRGFSNLKYFTVLSNLFEGLVCLAFLITVATGKQESRRIAVWRLCSSSAVFLTFTVVICFLGPMYGFGSMYRGANLWFHLLVPLMAIFDFIIFNPYELSTSEKVKVFNPVLLYGSVYLVNVLIHDTSFKYDIYGFVSWGIPVGIGIFAVIAIVVYAQGRLLCAVNHLIKQRIGEENS